MLLRLLPVLLLLLAGGSRSAPAQDVHQGREVVVPAKRGPEYLVTIILRSSAAPERREVREPMIDALQYGFNPARLDTAAFFDPSVSLDSAAIHELSRALFDDFEEILGVPPGQFRFKEVWLKGTVPGRLNWKGPAWFVDHVQVLCGLRVEQTIVRYQLQKGTILWLVADVYPDLETWAGPGFSALPDVTQEEALQAARRTVTMASAELAEAAELVVFPRRVGEKLEVHLAWRIRLFLVDPAKGIDERLYFVDAHTGAVLEDWQTMMK